MTTAATGSDGAPGAEQWAWRDDVRLRTSDDTTDETQRLLGKLEAQGVANIITRLMANSSSGFRPFVLMASALMGRATLPAADREAVILDIAARSELAYEWFEHEPVARRVGFTDDQMRALETGAALTEHADLFTPSQLLAIGISRTLVAGEELPAGDWDQAMSTWGLEGALELLLSVGWWGGYVPVVIRGLGLNRSEPPR